RRTRARPRIPISAEHGRGEKKMSKVGFVGLGIMGKPMALNVLKGGHELYAFSLPSVPQDAIAAGVKACANGKEVAQASDIIITMVPDTPHVESALFAPGGIAEGLVKGKIVVDMSSISPVATKGFAKRVNELGCEYLD